jgi:hypothetical protein
MSNHHEARKWPLAASFSACGWLKLYSFGVAKALAEARLHKHCEVMLGSSAGALVGFAGRATFGYAHDGQACLLAQVACAMVLELDFDQIKDFALECVDETHGKIAPAFRLRQYISRCVDDQFSKFKSCSEETVKVFEALKNRVGVSVTTLPFLRNRRYSSFDDDAHLKQVLLASCTMRYSSVSSGRALIKVCRQSARRVPLRIGRYVHGLPRRVSPIAV